MIVALRGLSRLVGFLLMVVLALLGLGVLALAVTGGSLAGDLALPAVRDAVSAFLDASDEPRGRPAAILGGVSAVVLGLLLVLGVLVPRRERLLLVLDDSAGRIAARRRPLGQLMAAAGERASGITAARARVKPRRRRPGGRLTLDATHPTSTSASQARDSARQAVGPLAEDLGLRVRVRPRIGHGEERVQ